MSNKFAVGGYEEEPDESVEDEIELVTEAIIEKRPKVRTDFDLSKFFMDFMHYLAHMIKENKETLSLHDKIGTIHFTSLVYPNHNQWFKTNLFQVCQWLDVLERFEDGKTIFVPDINEACMTDTNYAEMIAGTELKALGRNGTIVNWVDVNQTPIETKYLSVSDAIATIRRYGRSVHDELGKTHFTFIPLKEASEYVIRLWDLVVLFQKSIMNPKIIEIFRYSGCKLIQYNYG